MTHGAVAALANRTAAPGVLRRLLRSGWPVALLLALWWSRSASLDLLPLHNDEGLHLTRAVEVWNLHPFWQISDGKIVNHWLIAAFYPQNAPVFAGRIATVFVAMLGLAAAIGVARRFGKLAAFTAALLWLCTPYLFFYERLAFSDAEAGALLVLALWAGLRLAHYGRQRDAALAGLVLGLAMLFKFTAVPFALSLALVVLAARQQPFRHRLRNLVIIGLVVGALFAAPLGYLALRGRDFFGIALGWIGGGSGSGENGIAANLARLSDQLTEYGPPFWSVALVLGLLLLAWRAKRVGWLLLLAWALPLASIIILGSEVLGRHYIVALPLALTLAGAGLGLELGALPPRGRLAGLAVITVPLALALGMFARVAYTDPGRLPLSPEDRAQFIADHSSGYGLREAVLALANTRDRPLAVIASMFPDSCRRANFYAPAGAALVCTQTPGRAEIEAALQRDGAVYALVDDAPRIGIDVTTLDAAVSRVAVYPRPDETDETASVILWLLERR